MLISGIPIGDGQVDLHEYTYLPDTGTVRTCEMRACHSRQTVRAAGGARRLTRVSARVLDLLLVEDFDSAPALREQARVASVVAIANAAIRPFTWPRTPMPDRPLARAAY